MHKYCVYRMPMDGSDGIRYTKYSKGIFKFSGYFTKYPVNITVQRGRYMSIVCYFGIRLSEMTVIWHTILYYLLDSEYRMLGRHTIYVYVHGVYIVCTSMYYFFNQSKQRAIHFRFFYLVIRMKRPLTKILCEIDEFHRT